MIFPDKKSFFWGLGLLAVVVFGRETQAALMDNARVIKQIPTTHKIVALTFDDGPSRKTPAFLAILKEKHVRATFFVLGEMVERYPEFAKEEIAEGHEIGNHGYSHTYLRRGNQERAEKEMGQTEQSLNSLGIKCELFRPPGGIYDHSVLEAASRHGYTLVLWSVDSQDWNSSGESIIRAVLKSTRPGSIILFHDGIERLPTSRVLPDIIARLQEEGYEFVTVGELLQYYEERPKYSVD